MALRCPEFDTADSLHLPIIRAVKVRFGGFDMRMAHQTLNGPKVIPLIQKSSRKGMAHNMGMDPFSDQCISYYRFDKAVNGLRGGSSFFIWAMLPQRFEDGMIRIRPIPGSLQ